MAQKRPVCADCGQVIPAWHMIRHGLCPDCAGNHAQCTRCGEFRRLEDMRQSYCVDCRREYDRASWARQREARARV
jgi:hypothetical protein